MAAFLAGALLLRGSARAQPPPPPAGLATAAELRARGAAAAAARKLDECIEAYGAAFALEPDAATAGELGLCEEWVAHNVEAHEHLQYALEREVPAAPAAVRARWERYRAALIRVSQRVARVLLFVSPQEAEVLFDGRSLGTQVSGQTFAVLPGEHTWIARVPGKPDYVVTVTVKGGDLPDIHLVLPFDDPVPPPGPPRGDPASGGAVCEAPRQPPSVPCAAADGLPMTVDLCNALRIRWRRMDPTLGLLAGGLLSLGFTPDVGPGFFLGGEAHWRRQEDWGFQVGAEARFVLPTFGGRAPSGRFIDITLLELAVAPCARYKWALGCVFVDPGVVLAGGSLYESPEAKDVGPQPIFVMGVGPRLAVDIPIVERVGIRAFADLRFGPLPPTGYKVNGTLEVWSEPKVSGFVGLGISFR